MLAKNTRAASLCGWHGGLTVGTGAGGHGHGQGAGGKLRGREGPEAGTCLPF